MQTYLIFIVLLILTLIGFYLGRQRSVAVVDGPKGVRHLHSLPSYYGYLTAIWCGIPALLLTSLWLVFESTIITQLVIADLPLELRQ